MRVTPGIINAQIASVLAAAQAALLRQQKQVTSGRRITEPSDDPGGASQAITIRSRQAAVAQFQRNLQEARTRLGGVGPIVAAVIDAVTRAREAALQGANDSLGGIDRKALASAVNQDLETLVSLATTRDSRGLHVFGGQETTVVPYTVTRNPAGQITAVTSNARGIDGALPVEITDNLTIDTAVSGALVFGAAADPSSAFNVLIRLRDRLDQDNAAQDLTFGADVAASGASNPDGFTGFSAANDFEIVGPAGTAFAPATVAGSDPLSAVGAATSAIAVAAAVNAVSSTTGVSAAVTTASVTYGAGAFSANVTLDGTAGNTLVINGTSVTGAVAGATATARRNALVGLINAQVTGVVATAVGVDDFMLTAADGRNISIRTDATTTAASVNAELFGFTTGLTTEQVVARGGVALSASRTFTTTPASALANRIGGEGAAEDVRAILDQLAVAFERANLGSGLVGNRLAFLALVDERLKDQDVGLATELSRVEDLDFIRAVQQLRQLQTSYEASLASAARILQTSLLDFLR